jgi:hypothetical protein
LKFDPIGLEPHKNVGAFKIAPGADMALPLDGSR